MKTTDNKEIKKGYIAEYAHLRRDDKSMGKAASTKSLHKAQHKNQYK